MIFTPDRFWPRWLPMLAAALLLALGAPAHAALPADAAALIAKARADLVRSDGIAAEMKLRGAVQAGASRRDIAALMGEAMLAQGSASKAREWLGPGVFSASDAALGWRNLGRLERIEGHLDLAGKAFDRALALAPDDAMLWIDIGRLRYAGGEHLQAIDAADHALALTPANPRALEFRGQLVRDRFGLAASLPWFEAGLVKAPSDLSLLGEYAAALGDLGRARAMLIVTRKMLALDPKQPRAFYLQAVLAARAGNTELARAMLSRTRGKFASLPAAMLLEGVLEMRAGNAALAATALEGLVRSQPANIKAQTLLARAFAMAGEHRAVVEQFAAAAARPDASPYLLELVARSWEVLDRRDMAAPLLDRAARGATPVLTVLSDASEIGALLAEGQTAKAESLAERQRATYPGNFDVQVRAGDVQLTRGQVAEALVRYQSAALVKFPESLLLRMVGALDMARNEVAAGSLIDGYLAQTPTSQTTARLAAAYAAGSGDWLRALALLEHLAATGSANDVGVMAVLSLARLRTGDNSGAVAAAASAWEMQRASRLATQALGMALAAQGKRPVAAAALLAKAQSIGGDNPLLAEARRQLTAQRKG